MDLQESFINSPDHHRIPLLSWAAEAPSAVLVIAHGMAEHAARYQPLALWLNQQGVSVIAIQHRAHETSLHLVCRLLLEKKKIKLILK